MVMALTFALSGVISTPTVASAAAKKTVTVKTQKQLDAALKDKKVTSIVIKTSKNVTLKIKDGDYSKKSLTVASPKATINNYGDFKKISVNDGKSFTDRGEGNNIVVKDTNSLKLTTGKQSSDTKITISGKGGKISIVNNGSVDAINVKGKSTVTVGGNAKESPTITNNVTGAKIVAAQDANVVLNKQATLTVKAGTSLDSLTVKDDAKISVAKGATVETVVVSGKASDVSLTVNGTVSNVTVDAKADVSVTGSTTGTVAITNNAEGATIQSEVKIDVTLNADAKVSLDKGAEGSSVTAGNENVKTDVTNNTSEKVTVTDSVGKETTVDSGKSETIAPDSSDNKTDNKNESTNTGGGGGYWGGGSSNTGTSNDTSSSISGSEFANAIANATYDEGEYIVNLEKNVSSDVNVNFAQAEKLILNLGDHTISGSFKIEAPNATHIYFNDNGVGANGATVTGDFEVNAPLAHVENQVSINGTTKIHAVSNSTYCMFDKSAKFEVYGAGKIQFADNVINPPKIDIKTDKQVTLDGAIDKVEVQSDSAKITIAKNTAIGEVLVPEGKTDTVISGDGKIETVNASAPVKVQATVDNVVVNSDAAKITVSDGANISNVTVASNVKNVEVSGSVAAIDVSNAGNDIVISAATNTKIVVKDEAQAKAIIENNANENVKESVVYVTGISVIPDAEADQTVTLAVGEELDLGNYTLQVTYNQGNPDTISVSKSMLKNPDYVLTTAGTVEVKVAYAGKEALLATITYLDKDVVTLTSTVGQKEIKVNGDGDYFDAYTIGVEYFENNGLTNIIKATSKYGTGINFEYAPLVDNSQVSWESGLPATAGNYAIRAYTSDTDQCFGGEAVIWIFSSANKDYFEFDSSKIPADIVNNVTISNIQNDTQTDNRPLELAHIYFDNDSFTTAVLKSILDSAVSTHNEAQITYKYFAQGAVFGGTSKDGLPTIPGAYCIELFGIDGWNNESYARVYVNCNNEKLATVNATVSGSGITVSSPEDTGSGYDYCKNNSTITKTSDDSVTVELRNGCINQYDVIELSEGTAYEIAIQSGDKSIDIAGIVVVEEFVISNDTWFESGSKYEGTGLPTEKGRYRIAIRVEEDTTNVVTETWCSFVIIIK